MEVLAEPVWREQRAAHEAVVDAWTAPYLDRARRGEKHPVDDFLFTYYNHRPGQLRRWSPGPGVLLAGAPAGALGRGWVACPGGAVLAPPPDRVRTTATAVHRLLRATAGRPAQHGCFGLHEWAMVHGQAQDDVRHAAVPLRLGAAGTTAVVDALPLRCTHVDAYRFFSPSAAPRNAHRPTRATQLDLEQPGCLHATMDLYKWGYLLSPWVPSALVTEAFALARRVRELDMRASPYDLARFGHPPVEVETPEGRAQYAAAQRAFTAEAAPLRERLLAAAAALRDRPAGPATPVSA